MPLGVRVNDSGGGRTPGGSGRAMGQAHTVANGGGRRRRLSSLCHPFGAHSRNLSATFHATDSEVHWEQLNVNVATEEELMTLPRVTRHLARNIVDYRQAIGGFKKVEDLALVSGVGASLLQMLRPEITVRRNPRPPPRSPMNATRCSPPLHDLELYRLVGPLCRRPVQPGKAGEEVPPGCLVVALWNLAGLTTDKASNPGVLEVVCRTALENGVSIIACQEICSKEALDVVVRELRQPQLEPVASWEPRDHQWDQCTPVPTSGPVGLFSGFLFSTSKGLKLVECYTVDLDSCNNGLAGPCPCVARFKAPGLEFVMVSILLHSLKAHDMEQVFPSFVSVLGHKLAGEEHVLLMGDLPPTENAVRTLSAMGLKLLWPPKPHDSTQVWCSEKLHKRTGRVRPVECGLRHPLIPCGWHWWGAVSDLAPLVLDLQLTPPETPHRGPHS
ncbi:endonuclease/exonuclease/phosphatase family domain-containing protein 1 isoform X2 [Ixodes scapularis]|uniref:endonuclease/exonuclease/phosphatase family domain-containing protein 1 isoform X2 n=1 Tax=Ixodes scapularis TaxID=6945 RepID=UPI001A9D7BAF|nr:endonuclease/exonuclease/phosphatase family domain-containing protein 1 isoform X2 [Ixodes scapularis]